MSEPSAVAAAAAEVVPGVWHWQVHDDRIDFVSSAHALAERGGVVLVDPLPLAPDALAALGPVSAIVLTSGSHDRSAWRYRRELGVAIFAPALWGKPEEEPDRRYGDGDRLPGGARALFTPGAGRTQHTLLLDRDGGVAITADLFMRPPGGPLGLVPAEYMDDPALARRSAERLLEERFEVLCIGHGEPVRSGAREAIRAALAATP